MRKRGLICGKCGKPVRKGQSVMATSFARYGGITEHGPTLEPWLSVAMHLSCDLNLTPELLRESRIAKRVLVSA